MVDRIRWKEYFILAICLGIATLIFRMAIGSTPAGKSIPSFVDDYFILWLVNLIAYVMGVAPSELLGIGLIAMIVGHIMSWFILFVIAEYTRRCVALFAWIIKLRDSQRK